MQVLAPRSMIPVLTVVCAALLACACGPHRSPSEHVEVVVEDSEDLKQLQTRERELAIEPAAVQDAPHYQVLEGVNVETFPEYRIGPGDVLEIVYHIEYTLDESLYKLEVQDQINVWFPFHPQFSTTVGIRSDGRISLPLVGDVMAVGLTPEELGALLRKRYGTYLRNPSITVSLQEFNVKIDELKRAITTAPRGQSKIAPVAPDGRIALPIIGNIQAAGFTVDKLEAVINEKYGKYIKNLHTTLILNEINSLRFYVFGEVTRPGMYEIDGRTNMLDVLALAEGFTTDANLEEVVVYRSNGLKEPIVFMVDFKAMLEKGMYLSELNIQPADVIYVPKGWLDHANDMIAKIFTDGIYSILPFQSSFSVNYDILRDEAGAIGQ